MSGSSAPTGGTAAPLELPDLSGLARLDGLTAVVTGGTGGIGLSTAVGLSQLGAAVLVTGRDAGRGRQAVRHITATTGHPDVRFAAADLSTPEGVRRLAGQLLEQNRPLQLLVNNAGALPPAGARNADGDDLALAVNHWAPFLLTAQLLPLLRRAAGPAAGAGPRIVNVTSGAARLIRFGPSALEPAGPGAPDRPRAFAAYARSKAAALLATSEWAERLAAVQGPVVHAADPGGADTALTRGMQSPNRVTSGLLQALGPGRRSAVAAARSTLVAAAAPDLGQVTGRLVTAAGRSRSFPRRFAAPSLRQQVWSLTCARLDVEPTTPAGTGWSATDPATPA